MEKIGEFLMLVLIWLSVVGFAVHMLPDLDITITKGDNKKDGE